jgi:GTP cyclohydrolase II
LARSARVVAGAKITWTSALAGPTNNPQRAGREKNETMSSDGRENLERLVERYSEADVPTEHGVFRIVVYRERASETEHPVTEHPVTEHPVTEHPVTEHPVTEHIAVLKGEPRDQAGVHVRMHSECLTGEVLHSLKCDCRQQLDFALRHIADEEHGAILYLRQEGRGIGLGNKIKAYALQQKGIDTVDANRMLGFPDDQRRYHVASDMLHDLGIRSVVLLTNNPAKVEALRADGVTVSGRLPVHIAPNEHNRDYLLTKRARMGHLLGNLADLLLDAE